MLLLVTLWAALASDPPRVNKDKVIYSHLPTCRLFPFICVLCILGEAEKLAQSGNSHIIIASVCHCIRGVLSAAHQM